MEDRQVIRLAFNLFEPVQGSNETVPIIFLHGMTGCKENWGDIPQIVANATGRKTYAIDARNHGDSEWSDVFDVQINSDDLLHFMDERHTPKAILVGHSMGGRTAIKTALKAPERVEKLIVEDISVRKPNQSSLNTMFSYLIEFAQAALSSVPPDIHVSIEEAQQHIQDYIYSKIPSDKKSYAKICFFDFGSFNLKRTMCVCRGFYTYKNNMSLLIEKIKSSSTMFDPDVGIYDGPACFIYGGISPVLVGQDELLIRKFFPKATMRCIEDASHYVHQECALQFTEELLTFLQGGWNKINR